MGLRKSCSSIVTFMDAGYILIKHLKKTKCVSISLLRAESDLRASR